MGAEPSAAVVTKVVAAGLQTRARSTECLLMGTWSATPTSFMYCTNLPTICSTVERCGGGAGIRSRVGGGEGTSDEGQGQGGSSAAERAAARAPKGG